MNSRNCSSQEEEYFNIILPCSTIAGGKDNLRLTDFKERWYGTNKNSCWHFKKDQRYKFKIL